MSSGTYYAGVAPRFSVPRGRTPSKTQVSLALIDPVTQQKDVVCELLDCNRRGRSLKAFQQKCNTAAEESCSRGPFHSLVGWLGRLV